MVKRLLMTLVTIAVAASLLLSGCGGPKLTCEQVYQQLTSSQSKAIQPVPRDNDWWQQRHAAVNARVQQGHVDLLLLGDSITHGWDNQKPLWEKYFGQWKTVNAGFSGDRTEHVLWRLDNGEIENIQPRAAVLMIGTNNSNGNDYTAEEIADGISAIVCKLRARLPRTKILLLAIFPRGTKEQRDVKELDATYNPQWAKNDKASQLASRLADGKYVFFLDINKAFLNDKGVLTREIMPDLLHPKELGYERWGDAMMPTLEKLMATP